MILHQEQPTAGILPWTEGGKELLIRAQLWVKENGGFEAIIAADSIEKNHIFWTRAEVESVIDQYNKKEKIEIPGRSEQSISNKVYMLIKKNKIKSFVTRMRWTPQQIAYLHACSLARQKPFLHGITERQIIDKLKDLGLSAKGLNLKKNR